MVIVKIMGGLASQLEKYLFAYQIAKAKKTDLILDVSDYLYGYFRPFVLHYLDLPNCIITADKEKISKAKSISNGKELAKLFNKEHFPDIYLCKEKQDYLDFLAQFPEFDVDDNWPVLDYVKLYEPSQYLADFSSKIKDHFSVAVHIRRGDFVNIGWSNDVTDYKKLIGYVLSIHSSAKFYFFSNDIEWAERQFGINERFNYMHHSNGKLSDIEDFFCMAACDQRILSSVSGYGKYANIINHHNGGKEPALALFPERTYCGITYVDKFQNNNHVKNLNKVEQQRGLTAYNEVFSMNEFSDFGNSPNEYSEFLRLCREIKEKEIVYVLVHGIDLNPWYIDDFQCIAKYLSNDKSGVVLVKAQDRTTKDLTLHIAKDMDNNPLGFLEINASVENLNLHEIKRVLNGYIVGGKIIWISNIRLDISTKYVLIQKRTIKNRVRDHLRFFNDRNKVVHIYKKENGNLLGKEAMYLHDLTSFCDLSQIRDRYISEITREVLEGAEKCQKFQ